MKSIFSIFFIVLCSSMQAQSFASLDEFIAYAEQKSITLQSNDIKVQQASQGRLAAILSIPEVNGGISANFTNNTRLPVSILPGEAFGGPQGSTREITIGTQYQSGFNQNIDIKLINLEAWKNLNLAKLNLQISESDALVNKKILSDNIASIYYNIVQLQEQSRSTITSIGVADTLLIILKNKYAEGLVKQQDINDATVSLLNLQETKRQIDYSISQQYYALKILCDIPSDIAIEITERMDINQGFIEKTVLQNQVELRSFILKEEYAKVNLDKVKKSFLPTLSFVASNSYNTYNQDFTVFGGNWINSNYVGLKLNWAIPNPNMITNKNNAKYNLLLSRKSTEQMNIKLLNEQSQLQVNWQKANSQINNAKEILNLQTENYVKNKNLYEEGLIGLDKLLTSFNNQVNAQYNLISSKVSLSLADSKININNRYHEN
jgi:outer membrane protein TolC